MSDIKSPVEVEVKNLVQYPLKSAQPEKLLIAGLRIKGFAWDRQWMVVDSDGKFQSQRNQPELGQIKVYGNSAAQALDLSHPSLLGFIQLPQGSLIKNNRLEVQVHATRCSAIDAGEQAADWITSILGYDAKGEKYRIVKFDDSDPRYLSNPDVEHHHTAFADAYPYLLTTEESLLALNNQLSNCNLPAVTMDRFRPNIVIAGIAGALRAFQEHNFASLISEDCQIEFSLVTPCSRCIVTTREPDTGNIPVKGEPLRTLKKINKLDDNAAYFGVNMVLTRGVGHNISQGQRFFLTGHDGSSRKAS